MILTSINVKEYWFTKEDEIVKIIDFENGSIFPVEVKFRSGNLDYYCDDGKLWTKGDSKKDLKCQVTIKNNPEYFI